MKIHSFQGDLTGISAINEALGILYFKFETWRRSNTGSDLVCRPDGYRRGSKQEAEQLGGLEDRRGQQFHRHGDCAAGTCE